MLASLRQYKLTPRQETASLVALAAAVVLWAFFPDSLEVCPIPKSGGYGDCHYDEAPVALIHRFAIWLNVLQGFWLVVLAALAGWIAHLQRQTMHQQHESAKRIERAYVHVDTSRTERAFTHAGPFHPDDVSAIHLINVGKTPATIEEYGASLVIFDGDPLPVDYLQHARFVLGAGASSGPLIVENEIDDDAWSEAIGTLDVFLSGRVRYRDVFGACHETTFCFEVDGHQHTLEMAFGDGLNEDHPVDC